MKSLQNSELLLNALKGAMTRAEESEFQRRFASDEDFRMRWEEERALSRSLEMLPNAPVSSNFTARVLAEARRVESVETKRSVPWLRRLRVRVPRLAGGALLVFGVGLLVYQQQQVQNSRQELANSARVFSEVTGAIAAAPGSPEDSPLVAEFLQNFEAIQTLTHVPADNDLDRELLFALEK